MHIILPRSTYWHSFWDMVLAFRAHPTPWDIHAITGLVANETWDTYRQCTEANQYGQNLPTGFVPSTVLWLIQDDTVVGIFQIRHRLTPALEQRGGHIAYGIHPTFRGKGVCSAGLRLCLDYARDILGIETALITCHSDNIPSHHVMRRAMHTWGGREDTSLCINDHMEHRVWVNTHTPL